MKKRILLIDDDKLVIRTTKNILERQGYEVVHAESGDAALAAVQKGQFDLIVSDVRMPGKDGVATIKHIREYMQSSKAKEPPFIFITGYASEDVPIDAIKLGAKDYILKPFDLDELLNSVRQHIQ